LDEWRKKKEAIELERTGKKTRRNLKKMAKETQLNKLGAFYGVGG